MSRKKVITDNWKMNITPSEVVVLVNELRSLVVNEDTDMVFYVPAIDIIPAMEVTGESNICVGAENMYYGERGVYTGEVSSNTLVNTGIKYVVIGCSERHEHFTETDRTANRKVLEAFGHGIIPIIYYGETLAQRKQGITVDWICQQIKIAFLNMTADQAKTAVITYEPIWAVGTGKVATIGQVEEVYTAIRVCTGGIYDEATTEAICIQYGGSVSASFTLRLFIRSDMDGGLVNDTSLKPDLGKIINYNK